MHYVGIWECRIAGMLTMVISMRMKMHVSRCCDDWLEQRFVVPKQIENSMQFVVQVQHPPLNFPSFTNHSACHWTFSVFVIGALCWWECIAICPGCWLRVRFRRGFDFVFHKFAINRFISPEIKWFIFCKWHFSELVSSHAADATQWLHNFHACCIRTSARDMNTQWILFIGVHQTISNERNPIPILSYPILFSPLFHILLFGFIRNNGKCDDKFQ